MYVTHRRDNSAVTTARAQHGLRHIAKNLYILTPQAESIYKYGISWWPKSGAIFGATNIWNPRPRSLVFYIATQRKYLRFLKAIYLRYISNAAHTPNSAIDAFTRRGFAMCTYTWIHSVNAIGDTLWKPKHTRKKVSPKCGCTSYTRLRCGICGARRTIAYHK